jgi:hypothetical protein
VLGHSKSTHPSVQLAFFRRRVREFGGGIANGGKRGDGKRCSDAWGGMLAVAGINFVTHRVFVGKGLNRCSGQLLF